MSAVTVTSQHAPHCLHAVHWDDIVPILSLKREEIPYATFSMYRPKKPAILNVLEELCIFVTEMSLGS